MSSGPYRPPQWAKTPLTSLTCTLPPPFSVTSTSTVNGQPVPQANSNTNRGTTVQSPTTYFFDAVMRVEHEQEAVATEHPVQIGPAVVDHVFLRPARVTMEVIISDAVASYRAGQYSSGRSRSVSAFQTLQQIRAARVPIILTTRLCTYINMYLEDVRAMDDARTPHAGRFVLYLRQIITAQTQSYTVSVRPDATNATNEGTKAPAVVDPTSALHQQLLESVPPPH